MDLASIASVPDVKSTVLCDPSGALLQAVAEADAESAAAVAGFLASNLSQVGEELGLGTLYRVAVAAPDRATLLLALGDSVLSAVIQPAASFPAVEQAIDAVLQG